MSAKKHVSSFTGLSNPELVKLLVGRLKGLEEYPTTVRKLDNKMRLSRAEAAWDELKRRWTPVEEKK